MSDRTQDLKNLRAVATACKNYVDETKEQILWQVGQYDITTQDDNTTAYQKVVPTGATRAKLKSIGFISYKSENLVLAQKQIALSAGSEQWVNFIIYNLVVGETYTVAIFTDSVSNEVWQNQTYSYRSITKANPHTFTATATSVTIRVGANNLTNSINYESKLMLVKGSTAPTTYQPYFEGIRDSVVTSVKSYGANLFDVDNATYSSSDNWNITTNFWLEAGKTYTIWTNATDHNLFTTGVVGWHSVKNTSYTFTPSQSGYLMFGDTTYNWHTHLTEFKELHIMLNYGSTTLTYKPYRGLIDTYTVPSAITSLDGYGKGISSTVYNNVDFANGKYIKKANKYTFTGNETWTSYLNGRYASVNLGGKSYDAYTEIPIMLVGFDATVTIRDSVFSNGGKRISINTNTVFVGNGITNEELIGKSFYYELATPTETNITENTPLLEVEEGGYLVFENQYGQAVPSNVTYRIEVAR